MWRSEKGGRQVVFFKVSFVDLSESYLLYRYRVEFMDAKTTTWRNTAKFHGFRGHNNGQNMLRQILSHIDFGSFSLAPSPIQC